MSESKKMICWHCGNALIWGGDNTYEDFCVEGEGIVSNFSCVSCPATYNAYLPIQRKE